MTTKKPVRMDQNLAPCFVEIERSNQVLAAITGFAQKWRKIRQKRAKNAQKPAKDQKIRHKDNPHTSAFLAKTPMGICIIFALVLVNLGQKIGDCHIGNFNFERNGPKAN